MLKDRFSAWDIVNFFRAKNSLSKMATQTIFKTDHVLILGSHSCAESSGTVSLTAIIPMRRVDFILGVEPIC